MPRGRWRWLIGAAVVVALVLAAFGITALRSYPNASQPQTASTVTPSSTPTTRPLATSITWTKQCPAGTGFCADFPAPVERSVFDSATSRTGKLDSYGATVYGDGHGRYCTTDRDQRCQGADHTEDIYFVSVIVSKYNNPWTALTAVNGGLRNPRRSQVDGYLAARFDRGIYGGPGFSAFYKGKVYYAEALTLNLDRHALDVHRFLASIHFA